MGRRSRYYTHIKPKLLQIAAWCRDGLAEKQIADNLGIAHSTLTKHKNAQPILRETMLASKEVADIQVENALFRRAIGYEYTEDRVVGTGSMAEVQELNLYQHASVAACIWWLKNRLPKKWRDKQQLDHTSSDGSMSPTKGPDLVDYSKLSDEVLKEIIEAAEPVSE